MEAVIDRFEGEYVLVEYNHKMINIPKEIVPKEAKEGDVIEIQITLNSKKTESRKKIVEDLFKELLND